jgi:hypothetical protein
VVNVGTRGLSGLRTQRVDVGGSAMSVDLKGCPLGLIYSTVGQYTWI